MSSGNLKFLGGIEMKTIVLGILTITSISGFAAVEDYYIHCEKTYVDPEVIDLHERKIKFKSLGETYQTSAIYSDENGLYYQDYLENYEQTLSTNDHFRTQKLETDEQLDPFAHLEISEELPLVTSETLPIKADQFAQEVEPQPMGQQQPPVVKRAAWPYSNKRR